MSFRVKFDCGDMVYVVERWDIMNGWVAFMRLPEDVAEQLRDKLDEALGAYK